MRFSRAFAALVACALCAAPISRGRGQQPSPAPAADPARPRPSPPGSADHGAPNEGEPHHEHERREPPPNGVDLPLGVGEAARAAKVAPVVLLESYEDPANDKRVTRLAPLFSPEAGDARRLIAFADDPVSGARVTLRLLRGDATAELTVEVRYTRRAFIGLSALELELPGVPKVLDKDLDPHAVSQVAYLDRLGPKKVRLGDLTVLVDDGVDGLVVKRLDGRRGRLRVELFSSEARPFKHEKRCSDDWHKENPLVALPARLREPGDRDEARVELRADDAPYLVKGRYPDGRAAALVITDHADQSSPESFIALARGRSDTLEPIGGLLKNGLVITKSLFLRGEENGEGRRQLEDLRIKAVADEMAAAGSEIGPHSVTPNADERQVTADGLFRFDHYHPSTWIDHQPTTNCEAFTNLGWRGADDDEAARYRISDLLAAHGYRYIWAGFDVPDLDLLGGGRLDRRSPSVWPVGRLAPGDPDDRWLFATTWLFAPRDEFFRRLGPDRLDRLERDHGLAILHTYLESLHEGEDNARFANKNVLRRVHGVVEVDPRLEAIFVDLRRRIDAGTLWMPTLARLGDRLRAVDDVRVRYGGDGGAVVVSKARVAGMTFRVAGVTAETVDLLVDGKPPAGRRDEHGVATFWFDLAAAHPTRITLAPRRQAANARADRAVTSP